MTPQTWTLVAPWPKPLLSSNHRYHWRVKANLVKQVRGDARTIARSGVPHLRHVTVEMVWTVPDKRRRDGADNIVDTLKPWCDGMVDAGIVPDDTPQWMTKLMPRIEYVKGQCAVRFLVTGIPVESEAS